MRRFLMDCGALVSCVSFASALYLWMGYLQGSI